VREQMWAHFEAARELQRAVAQGRLSDARDLASWLELKAEPRTSELTAAARRIHDAPDLQTAAALTGTLASACSGCHEANRAAPVFVIPAEPPDGASIEAQMLRHQWAAARLWEGLIGPNDDAWYSGVRVMEGAKIDLRWTTNAKPNPDAAAHAQTLRDLTAKAQNVEGRTARAGLFGAMLYTCASCHAIVRPNPAAP
jgi:cytochrome c553